MERRLAAWAAEMARRERAIAEREAGLCAREAALLRREAAAAAEEEEEEEEESRNLPALRLGGWQVGRRRRDCGETRGPRDGNRIRETGQILVKYWFRRILVKYWFAAANRALGSEPQNNYRWNEYCLLSIDNCC